MKNKIVNIGWGFTKACNLNCKHCYNDSKGLRGKSELSLEDAKNIVNKLQNNGVKTINWGTGESGLVPEFWDLVVYVHSKKIIQGLTTNGWSVNNNTLKLIRKYLNDVDVSLDYSDRNKHNEFRRNKNSWDWAINALNLLKKIKVNFSIVMCVTAKNCSNENIRGMLKIAKKYGCSLRINWFKPTGRGKINKSLKLNINQVNNSFKFILKNSVIIALPDPYFSALLGINSIEGCPCGKYSFRITPNSIVVPCVYFTKEMKNKKISNNNFNDIISTKQFQLINSRKLKFCELCGYFKYCKGGCASRAYLEYGTMNAPDVFCYKLHKISQNPFKNIKYKYKPQGLRVHDNYLCTMIVKPK